MFYSRGQKHINFFHINTSTQLLLSHKKTSFKTAADDPDLATPYCTRATNNINNTQNAGGDDDSAYFVKCDPSDATFGLIRTTFNTHREGFSITRIT